MDIESQDCSRGDADIKQINSCRRKIRKAEESVVELSAVFNLAGNDARLKIMFLLHEERELCVCDLSDILDMKVPAVSQHLRKMKDGGTIENHKVGQTIYYSLTAEYEEMLMPFFGRIKKQSDLELQRA